MRTHLTHICEMALSQLSSRLFLPNKETKPGEMGFAADVLSYGFKGKRCEKNVHLCI